MFIGIAQFRVPRYMDFRKSGLPFVLSVFCLTGLAAQNFNPFTTPMIFSEGVNLSDQVEVADMDGDSRDDVVGISYVGYIVWLKTDAQGQVTEKHVINPDPLQYYQLRLCDWDNDQDMDVLYASYTQGFYYWQANDGSGQFGPPQPLLPAPKSIGIFGQADFNQDGIPDLWTTTTSSATLDTVKMQWYANDGMGNLSAPHPIDYGNITIYEPAAIDLDNDGDPDLVWIFEDFQILRMLNDGAGNFDSAQVIVTDSNLYQTRLQAVDFDGDGDLDIFPEGLYYGGLMYIPNDGTGNFGPSIWISPDTAAYQLLFAVADFSGDSLPDIMVQDGQRNIVYLTNNGPGQIFSKQVFETDAYLNYDLTAGDLDGDGDMDILRINDNLTLLWLQNTGSESFMYFDNFYPPAIASAMTAEDLDGDGFEDYIISDGASGVAAWYQNLGNGTFGQKNVIAPGLYKVGSIISEDLDGDGDNDILTREYNNHALIWLANDGNGNFGPAQLIWSGPSNGFSLPVYVKDFDNDQDLDILTAENLFFNDGTGHFDSTLAFYFQSDFLVDDLDNDQDLDIFSEGQWLQNDGHGAFSWQTSNLQSQGGYTHLSTALIDMDGDSIPEVFQAIRNTWWILFTRQNNVFSGDPTPIDTIAIYSQDQMPILRLQSADMDADGRRDLLIGDYQGVGNWLIGFNGGQGEFTGWAAFNFKGVIEPADFDNDGIPDLQCVQIDSNQIGWMRSFVRNFYVDGYCFLDENENGLWDGSEPPLQNIGVRLVGSDKVSFSNQEGNFRLYADPTSQHDLYFVQNLCLQYSSDSALLLLPPSNSGYPNLELGFKNTGDTTAMRISLTAAPTRCGMEVPFWVDLQNIACRAVGGRFCVITDTLVDFLSATPTPDLISQSSTGRDTLWWQFDSIQPSRFRDFQMKFMMPDANHVGDSIRLEGFLFLENDQQELYLFDSSLFVSEIRCAYDPNDKLVNRATLPPDYKTGESTLFYTVRFQNTGNDTASVVTIRDTLDSFLDLNTFQALGSSHPYRCELNWGWHGVEFIFEDIALPDSNSNESQSHGFVSFSILPFEGLPPGGVISNRADIYFDQNQAVSTNRVETVVQSPVAVKNAAQPDPDILIYPNPNTGIFTIKLPQPTTLDMRFRITDITGRLVLENAVAAGSKQQIINATNLPAGLYILQVVSEGVALAVKKIVKN